MLTMVTMMVKVLIDSLVCFTTLQVQCFRAATLV